MLLFLGVLFFIAGIVVLCAIRHPAGVVAIILGIVLSVLSFATQIPTGYTGIVTVFGKVQDQTLDAGFHFKAPWQTIVTMDNREQRLEFNMEAFSSDIQQVDISGSVNFSIDKATAMALYRDVGTSYRDVLIMPRLKEDVKTVFSNYTAEGLVANRSALSIETMQLMQSDLEQYGLNIIGVSIEDIDFTDAFTNAVEAKQVASQEYQKAQTEQQKATMEAEQAAERQKINAQANADVAKISADAEAYAITAKAEAEASANEQIAKSLTEELILYVQVQGWNGVLPETVVSSGNALPILNMTGGE